MGVSAAVVTANGATYFKSVVASIGHFKSGIVAYRCLGLLLDLPKSDSDSKLCVEADLKTDFAYLAL